jgi:MinD-like ATPase involved in chromosome partitioning or flagellar assembly
MLEDVDVPKVNENGEIIKDKNGVIVTTRHSADVWHHYAKSKWIGKEDVRLPNGSVITRVKSSAELTTDEFNKFMENVENFAAQWGVYLDAMETLT